MSNPITCTIDGCDKPIHARGWCNMHYKRWREHGDPLGGNARYSTPEEAFEARTQWEPNSGCLIWTGYTDIEGYGTIYANGKMQLLHRFAWEQSNGPIPEGEGPHGTCVLHRCDNPPCCNVDHLFLGTNQDNIDDMIEKGRQATGEDHGNSKLTETDVIAIRADTRSQSKIAVDYGVSRSLISCIKLHKRWKHVK